MHARATNAPISSCNASLRHFLGCLHVQRCLQRGCGGELGPVPLGEALHHQPEHTRHSPLAIASYACLRVFFVWSQVSRGTKMLGDEYGTASNIKSRVNRLSVLSAITSAQQRLKLYNKVWQHACIFVACLHEFFALHGVCMQLIAASVIETGATQRTGGVHGNHHD